MLTTLYVAKNDHRWVIFISLKTIKPAELPNRRELLKPRVNHFGARSRLYQYRLRGQTDHFGAHAELFVIQRVAILGLCSLPTSICKLFKQIPKIASSLLSWFSNTYC